MITTIRRWSWIMAAVAGTRWWSSAAHTWGETRLTRAISTQIANTLIQNCTKGVTKNTRTWNYKLNRPNQSDDKNFDDHRLRLFVTIHSNSMKMNKNKKKRNQLNSWIEIKMRIKKKNKWRRWESTSVSSFSVINFTLQNDNIITTIL